MYHKVNDVYEAIELARELKAKGEYDWFRGQRKDREVRSTLARLSGSERNEALLRLDRYIRWVNETPGLEELASDADKAVAVAQHYSIPTNFVDFTTEPSIAGFFASHGGDPGNDYNSCIICLNTADLINFWQNYFEKEYPIPEKLEIDVSNLWRMEAQNGVFLYCPYENLEHIYDFDRIIFPYTGLVSSPSTSEIYPERKSQLELLLDQHFMVERCRENNKYFMANYADNWNIYDLDCSIKGRHDLLVDGQLPPQLASWRVESHDDWVKQTRENYHATVSSQKINIKVDYALDLATVRKSLNHQIMEAFNSDKDLRKNAVVWELSVSNHGLLDLPSTFEATFIARMWDGVRRLPYSDSQLIEGITNVILVWLYAAHYEKDGIFAQKAIPKSFKYILGDCKRVEFGSEDGSYSTAYVSDEILLKCVRDDIDEYVFSGDGVKASQSVTRLLQSIFDPKVAFEFYCMCDVFIKEIIPVQVLLRTEESAIFYSPARLSTFGLP